MPNRKQEIIELIQTMPDDVEYDDIMAKIFFMQSVEKSQKQVEEGKTISHDEARARMSKWIQ